MKFHPFLGGCLLAAAFPLYAQTAPVTRGEEVVVTATRFADRERELPVGVAVVTREDIEKSPAATLPELLAQLPGIRARDLSGSPNLSIDMRGFGITGDQNSLVLLDGQRLSEIELVPVKWSAIPLDAVERIEIMRGSGAVPYGGGATGGTINIITRRPRAGEKAAQVGAGFGSHENASVTAGVRLGGEGVGLSLHANQQDTDNYRVNNRLRQKNLEGDLRFSGERGAVAFKFGADDQDLGLPGSITEAQLQTDRRQAATPRDFSSLSGWHAGVLATMPLAAGDLAADLNYRERKSSGSFFVGTPFFNQIDTDVQVLSFVPRLKLHHDGSGLANTFVAGIDWEDWDLSRVAGPGIPGRPEATQRNGAVYLQDTLVVAGATALSAGVRSQRSDYRVTDALNPATGGTRSRTLNAFQLGVRHHFTPAFSAYGKLGTSFRIPTVDELYNLFAASVTLLEPQRSRDRELGVDFSRGGHRYRAALYHMELTNELHFDPVTFSNENLPPTRRYGLELEGAWRLGAGWDLSANYTHAIAEFQQGALGGIDVTGRRIPLVPRHAANIAAAWAVDAKTRIGASLAYVGEQIFDADETNTFGRKMPSYTTLDVKVARQAGDWLLSGLVKNLTNEKYFTYGVFTGFPTFAAIPAPERTLLLSAEYRFR
ncbi:MAG: TonB-dependent receptor [Betaproteobacteria bacterium]|nr:TonB-dependent receptor [Betaproteobacteria bacterium]